MKIFNLFRNNKKPAPSLLSAETSENAITPAERAEWHRAATSAVESMALRGHKFTSDDVQRFLLVTNPGARTSDPRALGPVFQAAFREGLIVPTGEFWVSNRKSAHRNPKRVWVAAPASLPVQP